MATLSANSPNPACPTCGGSGRNMRNATISVDGSLANNVACPTCAGTGYVPHGASAPLAVESTNTSKQVQAMSSGRMA